MNLTIICCRALQNETQFEERDTVVWFSVLEALKVHQYQGEQVERLPKDPELTIKPGIHLTLSLIHI